MIRCKRYLFATSVVLMGGGLGLPFITSCSNSHKIYKVHSIADIKNYLENHIAKIPHYDWSQSDQNDATMIEWLNENLIIQNLLNAELWDAIYKYDSFVENAQNFLYTISGTITDNVGASFNSSASGIIYGIHFIAKENSKFSYEKKQNHFFLNSTTDQYTSRNGEEESRVTEANEAQLNLDGAWQTNNGRKLISYMSNVAVNGEMENLSSNLILLSEDADSLTLPAAF